ncbi:MAG: hypothetical protein LBT46_06750 [Planctomycetaceae bacterium]|jgi:hypothetical protein|nr:hypothetical protein [Planctomycetaceae bacterium]
MSLNNALTFIDRVRRDSRFRRECYQADGCEAFHRQINDEGYGFCPHEAWDAFRRMLLKAQDESEASEIIEMKLWYSALSGISENGFGCSSCSETCRIPLEETND